MKRVAQALLVSALFFAHAAFAAVTVGQPAPDFALPDLNGKTVKLADLKGRYVVLEWVNPECPYVQKHYNSANMPSLQKEYAAKNVVWLAINSTRSGHAEYKTPAQMAAWMKQINGAPAATLLDSDSKVGRLYDARNTPQMFIIDQKGQLIYNGAIDDKRSTRQEDVKTAKNYVRAAFDDALAGRPVATASTSPYGCTVKY